MCHVPVSTCDKEFVKVINITTFLATVDMFSLRGQARLK